MSARRALLWTGCGLAAAALAAAILLGPRAVAMAQVGTGYVAKQMCSCVFVAERSFESCRPDIPPEMDRVDASVTDHPPGVRASILGVVERHARHTPGAGCALVD